MPKEAPKSPRKTVAGTASFSKFVSVLQLIAEANGRTNVAKLSVLTGFPRPTVHRIVAALIAENLVKPSLNEDTLMLGPRLISLASQSFNSNDIRSLAAEPLTKLRDQTRETVHLGVPSKNEMVYVDKLESPQVVRMASHIGTRVPLHSSSVGKAYMAALPENVREQLLPELTLQRYTQNTIAKLSLLRNEIENTRRRGYAIDNEENEPQIRCFGAAILDPKGMPVGAVSISVPVFRAQENILKAYVDPLLQTVRAISKRMVLSDG